MPPSSITHGTRFAPHAAATLFPVATPPVKTSFWMPPSIKAWPVSPSPWTTPKRSSGRPVASKISFAFTIVSGVTSLGFTIAALPVMSAANTSAIGMTNGKFHGEMMPTTPRGT